MKFPRYLLAFCALFFVAIVVSAEGDEAEIEEDIAARSSLPLRAAIQIIKAVAKWAAKHCLEEAANNCKQYWKHPEELVKCGKAFLEANKGRCASG